MDKYDIPFLFDIISRDMPHHTDINAKLPLEFDKPFPKKLMDYSHEVDDKFLNDNLANIEEASHYKLLTDDYVKRFIHQQRKYHYESGILNHDNFFKGHIIDGYLENTRFNNFIINPYNFTAAPVNGADLETNNGSGGNTAVASNYLWTNIVTGGNVTDLYDQIAVSVANSTGNVKLGSYDDSSGPNNLDYGGGSNAADSAYTWRSATEWSLSTATNWLALRLDNAATSVNFVNQSSGDAKSASVTYTDAWADPHWGSLSNEVTVLQLKIGHS